ncbi:MAG: aconitase family protein [Rubellimicrobium sp.]|nr:aconitase family protein [Rubellimicrobium sp.]
MTDARTVLPGTAAGSVLATTEGLSFWGGVDPATARVIDAHHPLHGASVAGAVLMMPTSRGSCTGSGVILDLALNGRAPAALVFAEAEDVLTLGALVAERLFHCGFPVLRLPRPLWDRVAGAARVEITPDALVADDEVHPLAPPAAATLDLTEGDRALLAGDRGEAARVAMEILVAMAANQGAARLCDVTRVHIDGCIYASPANLTFAEKMAGMGARVVLPTTTNAISVDHANWRAQGVDPAFGTPAARLAEAYVAMGAEPSFTCAPYLLPDPPSKGEAIGWSESNAVMFANSVLGARTVKHPDFLDLFIALTGRAPCSGVYLDENRRPARVIRVTAPGAVDDAFWPMLGWLAGQAAPNRVPLITGCAHLSPAPDDLKALCAAFATTSAAPMLHLAGHTPEADLPPTEGADTCEVTLQDFRALWTRFNAAPDAVDLVAIGSPHASASEARALAALMTGPCAPGTRLIVTLGRATLAELSRDGTLARLSGIGATVVPDLCWCSISEPVFPPQARVVMTNSGKYAHYGPGLTGRQMRFGSLADCARAALGGRAPDTLPDWLGAGTA